MDSERPIRSFIAIGLPDPAAAAVTRLIGSLRGPGDIRWVTPDQYHLTLKFLGNATSDQLAAVSRELERISNECSSFVLQLTGIGAFPRLDRPRVIWLGIATGQETLVRVATEVDERCVAAGFARESRTPHPHLTLGRVRSSRGLADVTRRLREAQVAPPAAFPAEEILLMESQLRPTGAVYTVRGRFPLRGQESGG